MQDTGYGSDLFLRACTVAPACLKIEGRGPAATWGRFRAGSLLLIRYGRSLPSVDVRLSASPAGRMIGQHLSIRERGRWRYRSAQGVLPLPDDFADYMRGRHRQAVRTNLTHARAAGLTVESCTLDSWGPGPEDSRAPHIAPGPIERWTVLDQGGAIVADSILSVDTEVALLHGLTSHVTYARWLLHAAIVERLCGSCQVLLVNSDDAYLMSPGTRHFQRLLGYQIARLRLKPGNVEPHSAPLLVPEELPAALP
ncbi:MAG: hypothetical protein JSU06_12010 [Actinobacteria bacterium]|nr:hypothetical protein [Actinomycetota bacterium]